MKRALLICALATAALAVPSAKADDFTISFDGGALGFSGTAIFTGTNLGGGVYDLTGVLSGTATDTSTFGSSAIVSTSSLYSSDNDLYYPDPGTGYFDGDGLSFTLANGVTINLYNDIESYGTFLDAIESNSAGDISESVLSETVTPYVPVAATPEPSSLTLLGSSALLGLGYLRRRFLA